MASDNFVLSTQSKKSLKDFGTHIKESRIIRCMTQKRLSENAQISRSTLQQIENGCPNVAIGNYAKVLEVMGLQNHFSRVALNDVAWASSVMQEVRRKRYRFSDKQE